MHVAQILKTKEDRIVTTSPETSIGEVAKTLREEKIGAILVTDEAGGLAGILTERDIVHGLGQSGAKLLDQPVAELMTRAVVTCSPKGTLEELMNQMTAGRFRHLPVVDEGKLVGVISIGDVVKARLEELESETSTLRQYITGA